MAIVLVLGGCSTITAPDPQEVAKFESIKADPLLNRDIPDSVRDSLSANGASGGVHGSDASGSRIWAFTRPVGPADFESVVRAAVADGLRVDSLSCGGAGYVGTAGGVKLVGRWTAGVSIGLETAPPELRVLLTIEHGDPRPFPPRDYGGRGPVEPFGDCAPGLVDLVRAS